MPRPTIALGVRRIGKVSLDVGEWRSGGGRPPKVLNEAERPDRSGRDRSAERRFRHALRILGPQLAAGERIRAFTSEGEEVPMGVLVRAVATRTAPTPVRQAIVQAARAVVVRGSATSAPGLCAFPGCPMPALKGGLWCSKRHRQAASRRRKAAR